MLNLHPNLLAALSSPTQTLAWCWKISRTDGVTIRLTNYDRDLFIDGIYQALGGYKPSAVQTELGWNSQNQNLEAILDSDSITEADLDRGLYDFARLECFLINVLDPPATLTENPAKHISLYRAILGKVTRTNLRYSFEARGFEYLLNNKVGEITSKLCRARFGDSRCGVNIASYTYSMSIPAVSNRRQFTLSNLNLSVTPPNATTLTATSTAKTWAQAEAEAVSRGGHLVSIHSEAENQEILNQFGSQVLWIGLYKNSDGDWVWANGDPVDYTNWFPGKPDNYRGVESHAAMNWVDNTIGTWDDLPDTVPYYGIMQIPTPPTVYTTAPDNWFTYGTVTFTSGNNAGVVREIANHSNNTITLFEQTPFDIAPGTTINVTTGCDKTLKNCFRYNNVVNFQAEPYIPTPDKFASTPIG